MNTVGGSPGRSGNIALADDVPVPLKRRVTRAASVEDMFSAHDKIPARLVWGGTHTGPYGGIEAPASGPGSWTLPLGRS